MAKHDPDLDLLFTALGDPTRRAILSRLTRGPASVSELAAPHGMALPSFLGHLKKLEDAGLVATAKSGRVRTCTLLPEALRPAQNWLEEQKEMWERRLDQLDGYVMQLMKERGDGTRPKD